MEKYCTAGEATDDNMTHALCMLYNEGYKHTQYVTFIAFPMHQCLRKCASLLRYAHIACFVIARTIYHKSETKHMNKVQKWAAPRSERHITCC